MKIPTRVVEALTRVRAAERPTEDNMHYVMEFCMDIGEREGRRFGRRDGLIEALRAVRAGGDIYDIADAVGVLLDPERLVGQVEDFLLDQQ